MGSVDSANQNCGFKCSIIDPAKPKLQTKWLSGKQQFFRFIDILTKCLAGFIKKGIILVLWGRFWRENSANQQCDISPAGHVVCNAIKHGHNQPA